jgi:hypothetical protein
MKFKDLTPEKQYELYKKFDSGEISTPEHARDFISDQEPSLLDKAIGLRDKASTAILDYALPAKKDSDLSEAQKLELGQAKYDSKRNPRSWQKLDSYLGDKVGEKPLDLLEHPRFIAHPEIAKGLNSLASLANVISPSNTALRFAGVGSGAHLSDVLPKVAKVTGWDPSVRDAASIAGDFGLSAATRAVGASIRGAVEAKPNLLAMPEPYVSELYKGPKAPVAPMHEPFPMNPYASADAQEVADMIRRNDPLALQKRVKPKLEDTLGGLKSVGLSNAETAAKVTNAWDLPISKEAAQNLIDEFPNHPEVKKLKAAMDNSVTGEARTKGNYIQPEEDFVYDKGERTPIKVEPTSHPVIGQPHPSARVNHVGDPRWDTEFQEGARLTDFPEAPLMGEAAYTTTEPLDPTRPIAGRSGEQHLYPQESFLGEPDKLWHTPETNPPVGGAQKTLPIENNPDFYKLLQLAGNHANYVAEPLSPAAMQARNTKFGSVANELRDTIKSSDRPLPNNLSDIDQANLARSGGEGTTGQRVQGVRDDTTARIGLQEDLAPSVRGDKEVALVNKTKGFNDTRAMAQDLAENYGHPALLEEADTFTKAEKHIKDQEDYFKEREAVLRRNKAAKEQHQRDLDNHAVQIDKHNKREIDRVEKHKIKTDKISEKNAQMLMDFSKTNILGVSQADLHRLSTRAVFGDLPTALMHLGAEKGAKALAPRLMSGLKYIPDGTADALAGPWKRASIIGNVLAPKEEEKDNR